jgi:hypothetical protein
LHATFRGNPEREFAWFAASALTPLLSIDADRAARYIVRAIARGDRFLTFTILARLAARLHDLVPEAWAALSAVAARLLPAAPARPQLAGRLAGESVVANSSSRFIDFIRRRGLPAAQRHGQ